MLVIHNIQNCTFDVSMKRVAALILFLIYLFPSTGATLHYRYCMGEMVDLSFWGNNEKDCGKCGMEMKGPENNGCCNDEQKWVKLADDQALFISDLQVYKAQSEAIEIDYPIDSISQFPHSKNLVESKARVRCCKPASYLLNCVFRI
jgi:hypothetical protein